MHISTCEGWAINRFYRLTRMCSLRRLVWMKIVFLFNIRQRSPLGSRSSEWAPPPPPLACVGPIDDRCVQLEAAQRRMMSVWHQSTTRVIKEQTDLWGHTDIILYFNNNSDHSALHCFKSNTPDAIVHHRCLIDITMLSLYRWAVIVIPPSYPPHPNTRSERKWLFFWERLNSR